MTRDDLLRLATRLLQGPAPTSQKKVYGYRGEIATLLNGLPHALMLPTRVTDACKRDALPAQAERIPAYIGEHLAGHIRDLQRGRHASIVVIQEAVLLARFHVPLSFLYDLTGDAHALVLHLYSGPHCLAATRTAGIAESQARWDGHGWASPHQSLARPRRRY
jgi:hypothetical protein